LAPTLPPTTELRAYKTWMQAHHEHVKFDHGRVLGRPAAIQKRKGAAAAGAHHFSKFDVWSLIRFIKFTQYVKQVRQSREAAEAAVDALFPNRDRKADGRWTVAVARGISSARCRCPLLVPITPHPLACSRQDPKAQGPTNIRFSAQRQPPVSLRPNTCAACSSSLNLHAHRIDRAYMSSGRDASGRTLRPCCTQLHLCSVKGSRPGRESSIWVAAGPCQSSSECGVPARASRCHCPRDEWHQCQCSANSLAGFRFLATSWTRVNVAKA
jgi:hypothetical protein